VRNVDEIAIDVLCDATKFEVDARRDVTGLEWDRSEIRREFADLFAELLGVADEEVFVG
jgi:hypothetical protein